MRILFLSLTYPLPANNGVKMRTWALLRTLAAEGHEIDLLSFATLAEMDGQDHSLREVCRAVEAVPLTVKSAATAGDYAGRLRALFGSLPYGAARFNSPAMRECIEARLRSAHFDAVFSETPYPLVNLPPVAGLPVVLDSHNVEYVLIKRFLASERNPAGRLYAGLECRKLRAWEKSACERASLVMVCSERDRMELKELAPGTFSAVVPNSIDLESYEPQAKDEGPTILYAGGMDWHPNRDAVGFFISEIFPKVRQAFPEARFVVAGRNPSQAFVRSFAHVPGVEFTGTVPDIRVPTARAAVAVAPLRIGSGTRLKILEAAAMAKPVVSTRIGAEGLDFVDREEILLADEPEKFAQAVASLLADESRRRAIGQAARRRVERQYSLTAMRAAVRNALGALPEKATPALSESAARVSCEMARS